jgi:hypothetical protein
MGSLDDSLKFGPAGRFELQARERRLLVDGVPAPLAPSTCCWRWPRGPGSC